MHERGIELERTIFYPQGGGQPGDTGSLLRANGERILIANTRKGDTIDSVLHVPVPAMPQPEIGETLTLEIDWERRYSLMRLHTALHVMSCVVVAPVTGGNISPDKARLDFDRQTQQARGDRACWLMPRTGIDPRRVVRFPTMEAHTGDLYSAKRHLNLSFSISPTGC